MSATEELEKVARDMHGALVEAVSTIVEIDASRAGGIAMAVDYFAFKLRELGVDIPPTPTEEVGDGA